MKTSLTAVVITLLLMTWSVIASPAAAGENYAFLVAVGDYDVKQLKPLAYTRNDILEFSKALTESGFKPDNIVLMHDDLKTLKSQRYLPSAEKIRKEFDLLLSSVDEGDSLIVAFAGHGIQFAGDDRNFFCPVDADLDDPKRERLISLKEIYTKLERCEADRKLLLVDACRNDPLSKLARSRDKVKLNSITRPQVEAVPKGIAAFFSCSSGQESYEWPELEHGVFFHHILSGWNGAADNGDLELSLDELVAYARNNTQRFARLKLGATQTPQFKGEFHGTWVLRELESAADLTNTIGMTLKLIPAGEFLMGSSDADLQNYLKVDSRYKAEFSKNEQPQHRVQISKSFYMSAYETTQAEYEQVMGDNPSTFSAIGTGRTAVSGQNTARFPVENLSWFDAVEFCIKLSEKEKRTPCYRLTDIERTPRSINSATVAILNGNGYRLPTEAEWEYACRAKTTTPFHFGSLFSREVANSEGNALLVSGTGKDSNKNRTTAVGSYPPNLFGLCDMHGNVWEWCQDWHGENYYAQRIERDPQGPNNGVSRVFRGAAWDCFPHLCRSASRLGYSPQYGVRNLGCRLVLSGSGVRSK